MAKIDSSLAILGLGALALSSFRKDISETFTPVSQVTGAIGDVAETTADVVKAMDSEILTGSTNIPVKINSKDGTLGRKILSAENIDKIADRVEDIIIENTERIFNGEYGITPVFSDIKACTYCNFNNVCGFDDRIPGCNYRYIHKVKDEDINWSKNE